MQGYRLNRERTPSPSHEIKNEIKITTMKIKMKSAVTLLGLLFGALAISSCTDTGGSTHEMGGPPGKTHSMSDQQMPGR